MTTLNTLNGVGGGNTLGGWARPVVSSKTLTFPTAGTVQVAIVAATGSGGSGASATGANSSPLGVKVIKVSAADTLTITLGAPGAPKTGGEGNAGNNTVIQHNGVTIMTAQPGEPGQFAASNAAPLAATATVVGADRVIPGLQAQAGASGFFPVKGGAAVDVFDTGRGRGGESTTASQGGSVGVITGTAAVVTAPLPLYSPELGVTFFGANTPGLAGVGGPDNTSGGIFAGGGPGGGAGGNGAGGGGSTAVNPSGRGGEAYAHVIFVPES